MSKLPDYERHQQAYRLYIRHRNISQVSKEIGIPVATLHVWKKKENWDEKAADVQARLQNALQVYERIEKNDLLDEQVTELKLLELLEKEVYNKLKDGSIKPTSWKDLITTVDFVTRRRSLITGKPTERTAIDITGMSEKDLDNQLSTLQALVTRNFGAIDPAKIPIDPPKEESPSPSEE